MTKEQAMEMQAGLKENQPIMSEMLPLQYKAKGSTYGACGVRPAFVNAVLSRLKKKLQGDGDDTRLGLPYNKVEGE